VERASELAFAEPDFAVPVVSPSSSPDPLELLLALLFASELPPLASALLLFLALPLSDTVASFVPPLPPAELALASPELPEVAVVSPSSSFLPVPEYVAVASPVLPERAVLFASPPLASWSCDTSPPSALELFVARASEEAVELPERAEPEVSPESSSPEPFEVFFADVLPDESPPEAVELLLFVALPLPETLAVFEPPFPPRAELDVLPELPEVAEVSPPPEPADVAVAPPVEPEVALLVALPPFADWFWLVSPPEELLLFVAVASLEESQLPDVAVPVAPLIDEFVALDEQLDDAANATSWCDTI